MTTVQFDREDMRSLGAQVKNDIFQAILGTKDVKILPEAYGEFILTAVSLYGIVVRAELLETMSGLLEQQQLTEEIINKAIVYLCRECDLKAAKLGNQVELIGEVRDAPEVRH
jgi:hypothetical protein